MLTANKFALQNIAYQKFRSIILFLLILISSVCMFGTGIFTQNMQAGVEQAGHIIVADLIAVPSEYRDNAKEALFEGTACTILFDENHAEEIQNAEGVKRVSEQLYLKTLQMDCCEAAGMQVIAIDIHTDFAVGAWLKDSGIESLGTDEIIVGSSCGLRVNDKIAFFERIFTVVAVLDETGMGYDESVFVSFETADSITADEKYQELFDGKTGLSSMILIDVEDGFKIENVQKMLNNRLSDKGVSVYATNQITQKLLKQLDIFKIFGKISNFFVILMSAVALFSLITIAFYQKRNRIGSLLSVGIPKEKILQVFLLEYLYLMLVGVTAGIVLVLIFVFPLHEAHQAVD